MFKIKHELDKMLGGPFEDDFDYVPGVIIHDWKEVIYFEDVWKNDDYSSHLSLLAFAAKPICDLKGSVNGEMCRVHLPDGRRFYSLSYWNDIPGWRTRIQHSAQQIGLKLAHIDQDKKFVLSDGNIFDLKMCEIWFDMRTGGKGQLVRWPERKAADYNV
jgi:hypothetical protein